MKPGLMSITLLFVWPMSALAQPADEIVKKGLDARDGVEKIMSSDDGKSDGWMVNRFAENKDLQPLPPEELKTIADESDFDGPLVEYKSKGNQIELAGKETLDDKPVYRLKLTNKNGDVRS